MLFTMRYNLKGFFLFMLLAVFMPKDYLAAQDIQAEVIINTDNLSQDAKERLSDFKIQTENYLNNNKFHEKAIPPVRCTFNFNFTGASGIDEYTAQLFVASKREIYRLDKTKPVEYTTTLRILDERCTFDYSKSMQFLKNDVIFQSYLSLLNYYAYMIIGFDEDSYFPIGGNKYFQKALDICNKPMSGNVKNGWIETGGGSKPSRLQLAQELLNTRFDDFRRGYFEYHWMGLDSLGIRKENAFNNILVALEKIGEIKKNEIKAFNIDIFFDAKSGEIAETFKDYGNRIIYDKLIEFDPAHRSIYEEARNNAR